MSIKKYNVTCCFCGKDTSIDSSTWHKLQDGRQKKVFCSKECKSNSQKNGKIVKCIVCGKEMYRNKSYIARNDNSAHVFCSTECEFNYIKESSVEQRTCEICGMIYSCKKTSTQRFCSHDCSSKWQTTNIGELNHKYRRIKRKCYQCGKETIVRKYKSNRNHVFCSRNCSMEYLKENLYKTDDYKSFRRDVAIRTIQEKKGLLTNTKPQQIVNGMLEELGVNYEREYMVGYYLFDNYIPSHNLYIEVMGDFWHANPTIYTDKKSLYDLQKENIRRDSAKESYVKKYIGVTPLYLWENDLYNHKDLCFEMLTKYLDGTLSTYNSYDYIKQNL